VWWPKIDEDVAATVNKCNRCQLSRNDPPKSRNSTWPTVDEAWETVHVDFAGPFKGKHWLVVVDSKTNWPEVIEFKDLTSSLLISKLRAVFCRMGVPRRIVSDNGRTFTSHEFEDFCEQNGIDHIITAPYHPSSNGRAERFVQTFKRALQDSKDVQRDLCAFLLRYRNTPHTATGESPAQLLFGRSLRSRLDLLGRKRPKKESCEKVGSVCEYAQPAVIAPHDAPVGCQRRLHRMARQLYTAVKYK
jgi:transposase InsO family protein